jgi:three-Cys-motif partner protein
MSSENQCYWSADGSHLPDVHPHTKIKHRVLESYVQRWVETLTGHTAHGARVMTLIDGFCGGGMYRDKNHLWEGSSIRMIQKLEEGFGNVKQRKPYYELDYEFIFIDSDRDHTQCLELQLKNAGYEHYLRDGKCKVITGKFEKKLQYCLERVRARKGYSFFFLDPFGLDVTPAIVREILSLGRSEVLFNHMLSGLVRLLKHRDGKYKEFFEEFEADNYYHEQDINNLDFRVKQAYLRDQALKLFRSEGTAKFAHTFALMSNPRTVLYYLIHLASSPTALSVMRDTTWLQNNLDYQFHYGVYGIGYRTLDDVDANLMIYDIEERNIEFCVNRLSDQLMNFLCEKGESPFSQLYFSTIQENPATRSLYIKAINQLQNLGEIIVDREGKTTFSRLIQNKDIIKRAKYKQLFLLDDLTETNSGRVKRLKSASKPEKTIVVPDYKQLSLFDTE